MTVGNSKSSTFSPYQLISMIYFNDIFFYYNFDLLQIYISDVKTTMQDRGRYKCEYTGLDNRIHIMECSVLVFPFSEPTNVHVDEDPISGHPGVKVTWLPGPGRNSGYIVRYWDSMENVKEQKTQNTSLRLGNLTPGTEYWFTVFSTWQGVESGNSETVRIKTGYPR